MSKELDYRVEINGKSSRPASYSTDQGLKSNCNIDLQDYIKEDYCS